MQSTPLAESACEKEPPIPSDSLWIPATWSSRTLGACGDFKTLELTGGAKTTVPAKFSTWATKSRSTRNSENSRPSSGYLRSQQLGFMDLWW